jgi:phosphatidylglycerol:prolipoprotein diacylglycerol transferase
MDPVAIHIGPLAIHWYGLILIGGVLTGATVAARLAKAAGDDPEHLWNALTWCLLLGIVGARLYHVVSSPQGTDVGLRYYLQNPLEILAIWKGGLGIYGAVAGGALGMYLYTRLNRLSFWRWADFTVPGLALGQAIGRWGNYVNQELYGYPTDLPWGIYIDPTHRLPGFEAFERFHPTFLYESLWNLLVFAALLWIGRRFAGRLLEGDLFLLYGVLYPVGRILVETQRPDAWLLALPSGWLWVPSRYPWVWRRGVATDALVVQRLSEHKEVGDEELARKRVDDNDGHHQPTIP